MCSALLLNTTQHRRRNKMTQQPKLKLYLVSIGFANNVLGVTMIPALNAPAASAIAVIQQLNSNPKPEPPMTHLFVEEVTADQLKMLLRVLETGKTDAEVVPLSIVSQAEAPVINNN